LFLVLAIALKGSAFNVPGMLEAHSSAIRWQEGLAHLPTPSGLATADINDTLSVRGGWGNGLVCKQPTLWCVTVQSMRT
jgi:hypothetical protein